VNKFTGPVFPLTDYDCMPNLQTIIVMNRSAWTAQTSVDTSAATLLILNILGSASPQNLISCSVLGHFHSTEKFIKIILFTSLIFLRLLPVVISVY